MKWIFLGIVFLWSVLPAPATPTEGGLVNPLDSKTEVGTPLPAQFKFKNVGGTDGSGLCVFASITYCARYQNERKLIDLFDKMKKEPGGGWPEKVDAMIAKYGPGTKYVQDTSGNLDLLKLSLATGRPVGVTYDGYDTHYGNQSIAHMVQLVYLDDKYACISDNNFPGDNQYMWLSLQEFVTRWKGNHGGWAVILLSPPPPPVPHN